MKIDVKYLIGSGFRFKILENAYFGIAGMYEYQQDKQDKIINSKVRLNIYGSARVSLFKNLQISNILYYQPNVCEFADYRLLNEFNIQLFVSKVTSVGVNYSIMQDLASMPGINSRSYVFSHTVMFNF